MQCANDRYYKNTGVDARMNKWMKMASLVVLLIGAGYFFGTICRQIGFAYELILAPSRELINLLLRFLLALIAVGVTAGLVSALLRPVWIGMLAFALSGLAILLGWQVITGSSILLILAYILIASFYTVDVAKALNQYTKFSVHPLVKGQGILLIFLIFIASGGLGFGSAAHIKQEGFYIPKPFIEMFTEQIGKLLSAHVPEEKREEVMVNFKKEFPSTISRFSEQTAKHYKQFIPLIIAAGLFIPLLVVARMVAWVPALVLRAIFPLLTALGITKVINETQEVQRLIID